MGIILEMAISIYIIVKMYCVYDEQISGNFIALIAFTGFLAGISNLVVVFVRAVIIIGNFNFV
jgi:hypothetical protein